MTSVKIWVFMLYWVYWRPYSSCEISWGVGCWTIRSHQIHPLPVASESFCNTNWRNEFPGQQEGFIKELIGVSLRERKKAGLLTNNRVSKMGTTEHCWWSFSGWGTGWPAQLSYSKSDHNFQSQPHIKCPDICKRRIKTTRNKKQCL